MISQKQAVDNLQMTNDPKLPKAQEAMTGKENARNNCRTKYEVFLNIHKEYHMFHLILYGPYVVHYKWSIIYGPLYM